MRFCGGFTAALFTLVIILTISFSATAIELKPSAFDLNRFDSGTQLVAKQSYAFDQEFGPDSSKSLQGAKEKPTVKSPGKAFLMSALVPGLGQWYYGSKVKAIAFFGADVALWAFHFHYRSIGNQKTDEFNAYHDQYWTRAKYSDYLHYAYGPRTDDSIQAEEVSHHLPTTNTQQYYEMTGKYDQFAWGWDDARRVKAPGDTVDLYHWSADTTKPDTSLRVYNHNQAPMSAHRAVYLEMRREANAKLDQATTMIMVSLANHLFSAFEALITTSRHNKQAEASGDSFSQVTMRASLRSMHARRDTPYLTFTYRF